MLPQTNGQASLLDWLRNAGADEKLIRDNIRYDTEKTQRLEFLSKTIGLPVNRTDYISGERFFDRAGELEFARGIDVPLAFRIAPKEEFAGAFEIVKQYGLTVQEFAAYLRASHIAFEKALIRVTDYRGELAWSSIFLITEVGAFAELVHGSLYKLTADSPLAHDERIAHFYARKGESLRCDPLDEHFRLKMLEILKLLHVQDEQNVQTLEAHGYRVRGGFVCGYYEYVEGKNGSKAFTDMNNKIISTNLDIDVVIAAIEAGADDRALLRGMSAHGGTVRGKVRIINDEIPDRIEKGEVLVARRTTPEHLHLMRNAIAIVTDEGSILSHAAIIARELRVPCIVGTKTATSVLKHGDMVEVDADKGIVRKL